MKKLLCLLVFVMAAAGNYNANGSPEFCRDLFEPRATFNKMWVDYDVTEGGLKGMRLHIKFTVYDMLNMDAYMAVYFEYNDERGGLLKDKR